MSNIWMLDLSRKLYRKRIPLLPGICTKITRVLYSCVIPYTADIDESVVFAHKGLGVVIGHDTVIGAGTKILQNVTIGGRGAVRGNPVIGQNVLIGAGACVLGKIMVGDGAQIGANAVVISDVPVGAVVVGIPAKEIRRNSAMVEEV